MFPGDHVTRMVLYDTAALGPISHLVPFCVLVRLFWLVLWDVFTAWVLLLSDRDVLPFPLWTVRLLPPL